MASLNVKPKLRHDAAYLQSQTKYQLLTPYGFQDVAHARF